MINKCKKFLRMIASEISAIYVDLVDMIKEKYGKSSKSSTSE
jgi:hypothetical protein